MCVNLLFMSAYGYSTNLNALFYLQKIHARHQPASHHQTIHHGIPIMKEHVGDLHHKLIR